MTPRTHKISRRIRIPPRLAPIYIAGLLSSGSESQSARPSSDRYDSEMDDDRLARLSRRHAIHSRDATITSPDFGPCVRTPVRRNPVARWSGGLQQTKGRFQPLFLGSPLEEWGSSSLRQKFRARGSIQRRRIALSSCCYQSQMDGHLALCGSFSFCRCS
jgi:hypothetical protein